MAATSVDVQYFSPADRPCSLASFKRRLTKPDRVPCASRLALCISSTVLRLQEPLDPACRPFLRTGGDDAVQNGLKDDDDNEATDFYKCRDIKLAERIATGSNGSTSRDCEIRVNHVPHELSSSNGTLSSHHTSEASLKIEERERLRRQRIGLANKGRTPWNKGKSHSPETIARMSERNKIVMQDPKIREKLRQNSHPQSQETREKIRRYMKARMVHEKKQLTIMQEWKDSIAWMARIGIVGDDELQWDSYHVLKKELHREFYAAKKKRKKPDKPKILQVEHRLRISEAVRAKWADPEYRKKVIDRIHKTRQKGPGTIRDKLADTEFDRLLDSLTSVSTESAPLKSKLRSYNDPQAEEKLRKIRMLRERNTVRKEADLETELAGYQFFDQLEAEKGEMSNAEVQDTTFKSADKATLQQAQRMATERARILLVEAERAALLAAHALDATGAQDETLNDSLLEAWTLLDEANKSILNLEVASLSKD